MRTIDISEKLKLIKDHWNPHVIAELNGQHVKLAKIKGAFIWHSHADEDELFMVLSGELLMHFRDRTEKVSSGQMILIPKGTEHRPEALSETSILLFEPSSTLNTGNIRNEMTRDDLERI